MNSGLLWVELKKLEQKAQRVYDDRIRGTGFFVHTTEGFNVFDVQ